MNRGVTGSITLSTLAFEAKSVVEIHPVSFCVIKYTNNVAVQAKAFLALLNELVMYKIIVIHYNIKKFYIYNESKSQ